MRSTRHNETLIPEHTDLLFKVSLSDDSWLQATKMYRFGVQAALICPRVAWSEASERSKNELKRKITTPLLRELRTECWCGVAQGLDNRLCLLVHKHRPGCPQSHSKANLDHTCCPGSQEKRQVLSDYPSRVLRSQRSTSKPPCCTRCEPLWA